MIVLDASMALAWVFPDEDMGETERVFEQVIRDGAIVPALWWLEIANVLQTAVRRGRLDDAYVDRSLSRLGALVVETDEQTAQRAWAGTLRLSREEKLTPYDACYLELALRRSLPLATHDAALAGAARRRGVPAR